MSLYAAIAFACIAQGVNARVSVVEDEVIFHLRAPGAQQVYLVGDFNQWNATVEPMLRDGDAFEVMLFLVEGSYRYRFVVDGKWIVDPDNPGSNPALGSPLTLIEQSVGMILSTEEPRAPDAPLRLHPWIRYIGNFSWNDGESRDFQQLDVGAVFERDRLRGQLIVSSTDESWEGSLDDVETKVNRGFLEADLGAFQLRGFEHDSVWTSTDPVSLIGNDGLYRYNTGFGRHGIGLEYPASKRFFVRALYDDHTARGDARARISWGELADFAGGSSPDTTVYRYNTSFGDSDRLGLEVFLVAGDVDLGYVRRSDRGLHEGILADIERVGNVFPATVYATRENRIASLFWARYRRLPLGLDATIGYGRATSDLDLLYRSRVTVDPALELAVLPGGEPIGRQEQFEKSSRFAAAVTSGDVPQNGLSWRTGWDYSRFEFAAPQPRTRADIHRVDGSAGYTRGQLSVKLSILYTDQDYGVTPDQLLIDSPERNLWLNAWDNFTIANIVGIDRRAYTHTQTRLQWNDDRSGIPSLAGTGAGIVTASGRVEYAWWQADATWTIFRGFYLELDGRLARYDKPSWQLEGTFASGYAEAGYKGRYFLINLGYGFDPVVFDPVINDFTHIGRTEELRTSLTDGVRRSDAANIGEKLLEQEAALEGNHRIKLETIIRF